MRAGPDSGESMTEHIIPGGVPEMPLKSYLSRAYPLLNARDVLKKRDVKVNGVRRDGDFSVRGGDELRIYTDIDMSIAVAGFSGGLLAVIKPQGLPVDADARGIGADTALSRARLIAPGAELCHRLDAQTGGILILATETGALKSALAAFREHRVEKSYTAIGRGRFDAPRGVYRDYLRKDPVKAAVRIVPPGRGALTVETRWKVVEGMGGLSRMELEPVTGRTHQLRAHMAHYGHPILGDDKYGDRSLNREMRTRLCLWCSRIVIGGRTFAADAPDWLGRG